MLMKRISVGIASLLLAATACSDLKKSDKTPPINASTDTARPRNGQGVTESEAIIKVTSDGLNPFAGSTMFVDPAYSAKVRSAIVRAPELTEKLEKIANASTAFWIDRKAAISGLRIYLDAALKASQEKSSPVTATVIVYNLPDRDCAASASNGELSGASGLKDYFSFIDEVAGVLNSYKAVRIAAVIEPDSLSNVVTNLGQRRCSSEVLANYETGVAYAIEKLHAQHVSLYLDMAHGGWLGWQGNRSGVAQVIGRVLQRAGGSEKIRGFATNVANYSVLQFDYNRPSPWYDQSNPARDELTYVQLLSQDLAAAGVSSRHFIIDTGRNGAQNSRQSWGSWCNIANAAIGKFPQAEPLPEIDAFVWIKPPGESDGTSDASAPRYDYMCSSSDSLTPAPEAGAWFPDALLRLVRNS
ncbi:MAG: glycoside hydrolase family 6 protein [Proteobacteria bacterium]|nr:glycoside hydrolase family 6 protein [Pseudomonadota bacterium]